MLYVDKNAAVCRFVFVLWGYGAMCEAFAPWFVKKTGLLYGVVETELEFGSKHCGISS